MSQYENWAIGNKVVTRLKLADGKYTDVVGVLVAKQPDTLDIQTRRHGIRQVKISDIAIGKIVPTRIRDDA